MTAILNMIYCFLLDMIASFQRYLVARVGFDPAVLPMRCWPRWDGWFDCSGDRRPVRVAARRDGHVSSVAILAGAMGVRFLLQSVPFVRWGS